MSEALDEQQRRQFITAMSAYGLHPPEIIADGKLHRFDGSDEKRGKKSGWYVLYGDALLAGAFGDWRRDLSERWAAKYEHKMTPVERQTHNQRIERAKTEVAAERTKVAQEAQQKCAVL